MKGIYLAACIARHNEFDIVYQDIDKRFNCDLLGDMMKISLKKYDYVIATPPCNFWSKARGNKVSEYALMTKDLLPKILVKLSKLGKPFIVENVSNKKRFIEYGLFNLCALHNIYWQQVGRHIYFSNIVVDLSCEQQQDFRYGGYRVNNDGYNQGGTNVHNVIEIWLKYIHLKKDILCI